MLEVYKAAHNEFRSDSPENILKRAREKVGLNHERLEKIKSLNARLKRIKGDKL